MSIRKRTWSVKDVEKTAWIVDYRDTKGVRRQKTFAKKKDADAFSVNATIEVRDGVHVADSASATVEVAGKLWLASVNMAGLERTTTDEYARTIRLHINPFIGTVRLTGLTTPRLRAFIDELRAAGRTAQTTKRTLATMGILLSDAQERGLVVRNAVREMKGQRGGSESRQEKRQKGRLKIGVDIPDRDDVKALVASIGGRWRPLVLTAIFTGLRASELRGLRWSDIDFERKLVCVHQRADRYNAIGRPKSLQGERTVPATPMVLNTLREWKLLCPKRKTGNLDVAGNPIMALDLVFPNGSGNVETLGNILKRGLHPAWIAAGVSIDTGEKTKDGQPILAAKYTGLHCLRHWFASWCINRQQEGGLALPPKVVQERLGHATIAMTLDRYGHLFPQDDDGSELAAAEALLFS